MRITLNNLTGIASLKAGHFDLHEEFGVACLVEAGELVTLYLNKVTCRSWLKQEHPQIEKIKWVDLNTVILYFDDFGVAIVSTESWNNIRLGFVNKLFISQNYIFVSYDEQSFFGSWANELERNIISVFSREGKLQFGLRGLFDKERAADDLFELSAAYTYADHIVFIGFESEFVWNLDVLQRTWKKVAFPFAEVGIKVLTGDDKTAYAIFDNRWARDIQPERPQFELAVFDLASQNAAKQDFGPVETAMTAAGFAMNEIKFQPSSTGKIIASDTKQAALLEFYGWA